MRPGPRNTTDLIRRQGRAAALILLALGGVGLPTAARGNLIEAGQAMRAELSLTVLTAPWSFSTGKECDELNARFYKLSTEVWEAHNKCLGDAPREEGAGLTCSKASCQPWHDLMPKVREQWSREHKLCLERLDEHRKKQEREERARKRLEEEARQRQLQNEREAQALENRRRVKKEREELELKLEERQERAEARAPISRETGEGGLGRPMERPAREPSPPVVRKEERSEPKTSWGLGRRDEETAPRRAEWAANTAAQEAARRERDAREQSLYDSLLKELAAAKAAKDQVSSAMQFVRNPFRSALEAASEQATRGIVGAAVDAAMPGAPAHNDRYDAVASVVDSARARALAGNPFAEKLSGAAFAGVQDIHRKTLGEAQRVADEIVRFGGNGTPPPSSPPTFRPSPPPSHTASPVASLPQHNPFAPAAPVERYIDPDSRTILEIPPGHALYRDPETGRLSVIRLDQLRHPPPSSDRPELGERGCSSTGVGIVTPECEKLRRERRNPFASR